MRGIQCHTDQRHRNENDRRDTRCDRQPIRRIIQFFPEFLPEVLFRHTFSSVALPYLLQFKCDCRDIVGKIPAAKHGERRFQLSNKIFRAVALY